MQRPKPPQRIGGLLLALAAVLLASGCGELSKKEYIREGDAICRQTNIEAAKTPVPAKDDIRGTAEYLRITSRVLTAQADRLDALDAPEKDEPRLRDVFRRQRDALAMLQTAANQFQLSDTTNAEVSANNASTALLEARVDLQGYGFQDCATQ